MSKHIGADDLTLPVKRTEGETIEERLTDNAYHNILPARYLRKDDEGELVESQEDLFERVARNVALAEAVFEARKRDIEVTVTPDQIKPDHPRRDELAAEVFGTGVTVDDDHERPLTEHNVNKFAYETVVPELPAEVREHVETTAAEFQKTMEQLSFTPNCVPPDSLVAASGGLKPISGVEPGERVYDDESGAARVEHKYDNGEKRVVEIETESGYTVRATPEHYFRVITANGRYEWEQVKNIEPTDTLAVQKNFLDDDSESPSLDWQPTTTDGGAVQVGRSRGQFQPPAVMTDDLAEWLGLYIGDGTTRDSGIRVTFDDSDPDLLDHWVELTESVFGFEPTAGPHHNGACFVGRASRRDLTDFLNRNDLLKTNSGAATVPTGVLQSGRSGVAAFLRGLFEADGTVGDRQIELYTHSEQLGRQAQKLLLGLGIRSRLSEKRDGYRLSIRKNVCGKRFVDHIGFLSERKRERAARFTDVAENASSIEIPNQTERLQDWWQESELGLDAYRDLSQFLSDPDSECHQDIGKGIFERYADTYPELWDSPVAELVERDQFYERVERVTEVGTMAVEDMQVPRRNTYVVEGFVSHNSPTLMNAGDELQQLSACFVDSPADDIDEIHQTAKEAAQVFQCLTEESTVVTEQRGVISVSEVEAGDRIAQRTADGFQYKPVEETHEYADAETLTVQLANGLSVRGTPNHRLAVDDEWTRLDEIRAGQEVHYALGWLRETERQAPELASAGGAQWENSRSVKNADVVELYRKGLSDYESPDQLDCDKSTVQRRRSHEPELPPDGSGGRERGSASFDEDTALDLYREGHTDAEIAETLDVHQTTVGQFRARERLEANGTAVNAVSQPAVLTEELAELVGLWLGDGSWHQDGVRFHVGRESTADYIDHLSRRLFGTSTSRTFADGCYEVEINSHEIKRWWRANFDCKPDGARSARVPQVVRKAPAETVEAFLRGYFTADGTLLNDTYPKLYSASERAIDDVATLMMGLGYPVEKSVTRDEEAHPYYGLIPTTGRGREAFLREVGFIDERRETGLESIGSVESRDASSGEYTVEVESVVESGEATVHDITVADNHQYVTDGIVSHNSGGGMGYAFWKLRPYGDPVGSTGGIASGPITFMRTYDQMCFPPGTRILTPSGQQPIEELDDRDLVIDENGDRQPVVETMERQIDEDIIEITPERLNRPIRATGEHPFRVARGDGLEWVDARDLRRDDLLVLGHASDDNGHTLDGTIDLGQIASGPLMFTDGGVRVNREYYSAKKGTTPQAFTDEVPVKDFATLAGWYLAEGCVVYRRGMPSEVTFTLHNDERDAAAEIQDALDSFGVSSRLDPVEERNTLHIHAEHSSFAQFVDSLFSTGASEKRVPEVLWNAPPETQARVLETLFAGDGRLEKRGKSQRVKLKLANETIIDFAFQAGLRCGVQFSRHDREPDNRQPTYEVGASISTALGTPLERLFDEVDNDFATRDRTKQEHGREIVAIDSVETVEYEGSVYNAEVAGTHTYVAEDLVVHNCETIAQGGARRGAQMGVMRVSHPDVIQFIHAKNKDVSLAHTLRLNDPDDFTHTSFADALEEARELIDDDGKVPEHLRNAVEGHLSNFNISVGITDEFMDAVKNNDEYTFTNPRTGEPHVATPQTAELYEMFGLGDHVEVGKVLSVPASIVWDHIIEGAHENGEPGVVYLERINKQHSFDVDEHPDHQILATNPCVTGDTLVSTENGLVPAEDLYEQGVAQDIVVDGRLSDDRVKEASSVYKTGKKDVSKLTTEEGYELRLTADHRVMTDNGWVEAGELDAGDTVHIQNRKGEFGQHGTAEEGRVLGWLVGDGHLKPDEERAVLNLDDEDATVSEQLAADVNDIVRDPVGNADHDVGVSGITRSDDYRGAQAVEQRVRSTRLYEYAEEAGLTEQRLQVPKAVMRGSEEMARAFLRALFSADGSVQGTVENGVSVRLASIDADLLKEVQRLLLNFGVASKVDENRKEPRTAELPDGQGETKGYETEGFHELVVGRDNLVRFAEEIGFLLESKNEALDERLSNYGRGPNGERFEVTVESVEHDGHEAVYDLTEPDTESFVANGVVVHNCGEQPLEEYEACNLGHINLSTIVHEDAPDWRHWEAESAAQYDTTADAVDSYLGDALDWEELNTRIEIGTQFLENVVTVSDFPVEEIEQTVREMRKIGLGIMGLAQLYVQLGVEYGSDVGDEIAKQVMMHINHRSKEASHELARDRGVFEAWDESKYADPVRYRDWFEHHTGESADDWEDGYPIRNHNTTTIAPTGTTSMVGNTTGGCEPIYSVAYYKNVSDDVQGEEMLVEFDDYFLRTLTHNDIDVAAVKEEATEQMAANEFDGVTGLSTVPDAIGELFVTTDDLSAKQHASVQCACQQGVDSSISKTTNAPHDSTVEDAKEVFEYIYDHGGKGVTYYRDGTRSKQVLTTRAQNTEFTDMDEEAVVEFIVEQIEQQFGGIEGFLEDDEIRSQFATDIEEMLAAETRRYAEKKARPDQLHGVTQRIETGYGKLYVTINEDPQTSEPFELFANTGHSGGFTNSFTDALAKTISIALRSGVDPEEVIDKLQGVRSPKIAWDKGEQINSIPDAFGTALRRYVDDEIDAAYPDQATLEETASGRRGAPEPETDGAGAVPEDRGAATIEADHQSVVDAGENPECPECGALSLYYSEGCKTCENCGWSEC